MIWLRRLQPVIRPAMRVGFRLMRSMTLGVRGLVLDDRGRVLLVEHTYIPGWHLPGGGVERGESCEAALARELAEEAGVRLLGPARLLGVENDEAQFRGDRVLLYRIDRWEPCASDCAGEILRADWFDPAQPPEGATASTLRRIVAGIAAGKD